MPSEPNRNNAERTDDRMNWQYQDKSYNELFKLWRKQHRSTHGFYYTNNPNELTYKDGYGFVKDYPEAIEAEALRHVFNIVGMTILLIVGADIFYLYILPVILNRLGADIYRDPFTGAIYGNDWLIIGLYVLFEIIKRIIPFMYCYKKLNMPLKVMVPMKIANKKLFVASVPAMFLTSGVCCALSAWIANLLDLVYLRPANWIYLPEEPKALVVSLIANIIVMPIVSEVYVRGPVMQLIRQFGDGFALVVTALLITMITYDLYRMCYVFITSLVIGYFCLRTGSVLTGVVMRIAARAVACGMYMVYINSGEEGMYAVASLIFLFVAFGGIYMINYMMVNCGKLGMTIRPRYLPFGEKCFLALTSIPTVIGLMVALIFFLLHLQFAL